MVNCPLGRPRRSIGAVMRRPRRVAMWRLPRLTTATVIFLPRGWRRRMRNERRLTQRLGEGRPPRASARALAVGSAFAVGAVLAPVEGAEAGTPPRAPVAPPSGQVARPAAKRRHVAPAPASVLEALPPEPPSVPPVPPVPPVP